VELVAETGVGNSCGVACSQHWRAPIGRVDSKFKSAQFTFVDSAQ